VKLYVSDIHKSGDMNCSHSCW